MSGVCYRVGFNCWYLDKAAHERWVNHNPGHLHLFWRIWKKGKG